MRRVVAVIERSLREGESELGNLFKIRYKSEARAFFSFNGVLIEHPFAVHGERFSPLQKVRYTLFLF